MKRVLVTGGRGFVGSNLVRRLIVDGHDVNLLLRKEGDDRRLSSILASAAVHDGDLRSSEDVDRVVHKVLPEWVIHLAAYGAYSWQTDTNRIVETNFIGLVNLVSTCQKVGVESFVNIGSSSEYGNRDHAPTKTEWLEPNSDYAVTKASAALYCRSIAQRTCDNIVTLRLYSAYGPYEEPQRLIPQLIVNGVQGSLPPLASPDTVRNYIYIDDVVKAIVLALRLRGAEEGAIYNLGSGVQSSIFDLVQIAMRTHHLKTEPQWGTAEARKWDTDVWVADSRKIISELGWKPKYTIEDGYEKTVRWLENEPSLWPMYGITQK